MEISYRYVISVFSRSPGPFSRKCYPHRKKEREGAKERAKGYDKREMTLHMNPL